MSELSALFCTAIIVSDIMYCRYDKVVYVDAYFNPDSFTTFFHLPILEAVLLFEGLEKSICFAK